MSPSPRQGVWRRLTLRFVLWLVLAAAFTLAVPLHQWRTGRQDVTSLASAWWR